MTEAPHEYCDLVMKGGVASGIVYPNAVLKLADKFRFKNIGGTSVGAMAAAATAAAALGERRLALGGFSGDRAKGGVAGLRLVAHALKQRGFIFSLFQPVRPARTLYRLASALFAKSWGAVGWALVLLAPVGIPILLLVEAIGWRAGGLAGLAWALLPALVFALLGGVAFALFRAGRVLKANGFGLCPGMPQDGYACCALTLWLHETLQSLAGQRRGRPLLFEDLWKARRYDGERGTRAIDLQMVTTGVSHQEPRTLPFEAAAFWFRREEFERLFPKSVVAWMIELPPLREKDGPRRVECGDKVYYRLPEGGKLPVLVAARMSLSFPILISAVPLHEPDRRATGAHDEEMLGEGRPSVAHRSLAEVTDAFATGGARTKAPPAAFRCCWFSDGGLSSNLPIHMFDGPLPRWPTFAIDLVYPGRSDGGETKVFLPSDNKQGWQCRYRKLADAEGLTAVASFLMAIVETMRNWRDLMQMRAPGYRDRIVHVPLLENEGGLNLDMPQPILDGIAAKGSEAGRLLCDQFSFENHWWVRWRTLASAAERYTIAFAHAAAPPPDPACAVSYASATAGRPKPPSYAFTLPQQAAAQARFAAMLAAGNAWGAPGGANLTYRAPKPLPQLRIVPTF